MRNDPTVSVIIPAYNLKQYLAEAINSALDQSHPPYEVIVVDDGSTDNTADITQQFGGRIKYIRQKNSGVAAARNRGIQEAIGDWVAFLDADDVWFPWFLEEWVKLRMRYHDAAAFCGGRSSMDERVDYHLYASSENARKISIEEFAESNPISMSSVICRKDALLSVGGFDVSFSALADYDLWMRLVKRYPMVSNNVPVFKYRIRLGSLSMNDRTYLPEALRLLNKAFGENGALAEYNYLKNVALSREYIHVSWMAFQRGDRLAAIRYLALSHIKAFNKKQYFQNKKFRWIPLLMRYMFGSIKEFSSYTKQ